MTPDPKRDLKDQIIEHNGIRMELKIIVCIKSVVLKAPGGRVTRTPESSRLNPFDRPVLETAFRLRGENGGTVSAVSMGPEAGVHALYEALALGADRGVLINDPALSGSDTLVTSTVLGSAVERLAPYDLLLFGTRTSDSDTGHVGPQTAVLLDLPLITNAHSMDVKGSTLVAESKVDGFVEKYEAALPLALTINPLSVQVGDLELKAIESAYDKDDIERWNLSDLSLSSDQVGEQGSPTRVLSMKKVRKERKCEFISGSIESQADELLRLLMESGRIA